MFGRRLCCLDITSTGELAEDRKDIKTYKVRPSVHALFAEIAYTVSFIAITVWLRGHVYMLFTISFIIIGGLCLLTHFAKISVFGGANKKRTYIGVIWRRIAG